MPRRPRSALLCPICRHPVAPGSAESPFCSQRCRSLDLGRWASGAYAIPAPFDPAEPDSPAPAPDGGSEDF